MEMMNIFNGLRNRRELEIKNLPQMRREQLFIEMLSGLYIDEANLICLVKDKKLNKKYSTITEKLVRETFPNLLP